ncbi:type II secretion system protein GspE, partial [bacterium]|nr:type II secretion system protein GspE [bacterium]
VLAHLDLRHIDSNNFRLFKGAGCDSCGGSGYKGRMGIYEVMSMTENQKSLILRGGSVSDITTLARKEGMLTLRESALRKSLVGITTLDEVIRVTAGGH